MIFCPFLAKEEVRDASLQFQSKRARASTTTNPRGLKHELIKITGGGLLAASDSPSTQDLGNTVILLGLGIQVAFFSGFMIVAGLFHLQITKRPTAKSRSTPSPWKKLIMVLYLVSILIMVRSVFRMIEYAQGHNGALIRREIYVYILDALLMLIVTILFSVWHPSTLIAGENKVKVPSDESSDTIPMFGRYASIA